MAYRNWQHQSDKLNVNMTPKKSCEVVVVNNANTTVINGGSRKKNSKGRVINRSGAATYTQNSKTQRISATLFRWCPTFSNFFFLAALAGPWCL